jgi:ribosomal protein L37AE/L43A
VAPTRFVCDSCGGTFTETPKRTATGRELCADCNLRFQGTAAAMINGGGVPEAIATAGWASRVSRFLRPGKKSPASD